MRSQSYTERKTYFNSFKKSNGAIFVDYKFPPKIRSVFVNYYETDYLEDVTKENYITYSGQVVPEELIKTIEF